MADAFADWIVNSTAGRSHVLLQAHCPIGYSIVVHWKASHLDSLAPLPLLKYSNYNYSPRDSAPVNESSGHCLPAKCMTLTNEYSPFLAHSLPIHTFSLFATLSLLHYKAHFPLTLLLGRFHEAIEIDPTSTSLGVHYFVHPVTQMGKSDHHDLLMEHKSKI